MNQGRKWSEADKLQVMLLLLFAFNQFAWSQSIAPDSAQYYSALKAAKSFYQSALKENYLLFNGGEYGTKGHQVNGFPFFASPDMLKGTIYYKDYRYDDVEMKYDITSDQIVIYNYPKTDFIALQNERIPEFNINGHEFFHMDSSVSQHGKGYYERLCKGAIFLWAKRFKKIQIPAKAEDQTAQFKEFDSYYLQRADNFYPISNKRQLEHEMEDKLSEIKTYVRQNKIDFRHHFEEAAIKTVNYYNQLIN